MAQHAEFSIETGVPVFFCDPHSPWQLGSNENTNGLLRQYWPKSSDLRHVTQAECDATALRLNTRPRETLNWQTQHKHSTERYLQQPVEIAIEDRNFAAANSSTPSIVTTWSDRWAASAQPATTPPWRASSAASCDATSGPPPLTTPPELRIAIVTWIERTYRRGRRQAAVGRLAPLKFETIMSPPAAVAA